MIEHAFTPAADDARVSISFASWYINPAVAPGYGDPLPLAVGIEQKEGAVRHDRQVVFVKGRTPKSPTYAVFRDTFTGPGKLASWLNLNLLGRKTDIQASGKNVTAATEFPMQLELRFLQDSPPALETKEDDIFLAIASVPFGANVLKRLMADRTPSPNWIRKDGKPADFRENLPNSERHVILRLAGKPGEEFHWVLFPRTKDEPAPQIERPAPGVVKVTHVEGTDWIFSAPDRLEWSGSGVAFKGTAGAVRIAKDGRVTLQLLAGSGEVSYQGTGIRGAAPLTKDFDAGTLKPGVETVKPAELFAVGDEVLKPGQGGTEHIATEAFTCIHLCPRGSGAPAHRWPWQSAPLSC